MKNQRKEMTERINTYISFDAFEGSIDSIVKNLLATKQLAIDKDYTNITIEYTYGWDNDRGNYEVFGTRPETDKEMNKRLVIIQKSKETKKANRLLIEKKEYAQYLKLKEKYDDESKY